MSAVCEVEPEVDNLVLAVRALDKSYQRYLRSDGDDLPQELITAISVVCALVTTSFPKDDNLVHLFLSCTQLAGSFQDVMNEEPGSASKCLARVEDVLKFLEAAESDQSPPPQSVKSMLTEFGAASMRYQWVAAAFGDIDPETEKWTGPFFTRNGQVNIAAIEKEAANPGSVLGDDFKPLGQQRKQARIKAAAIRQLNQLQAGLFRPEGGLKPEKATVLEMLQEGQYVDVIARVKGVTVGAVTEIARQNGIKIADRELDLSIAANDASSDPMAEAAGYQKPTYEPGDEESDHDYDSDFDDDQVDDTPDEVESIDDDENGLQSAPTEMTHAELEEFALGFLAENPNASAHEILATAVEETGKSVRRQMLTPILRSLKGAVNV
jgi:hypothetical protein